MKAAQLVSIGILLAACTSSPGATSDSGLADTSAGSSDAGPSTTEVNPIYLAFTFHLEGANLVADKQSFDRYVGDIRSTSTLFHKYGGIPTWEAAEIVKKSKVYGVNILKELEESGDAIGLHANGFGYAANGNYDQAQGEKDMLAARADIDALGVKVRHASNVCSAIDWVKALRLANLESASGIVDYCLKSLPDPGSAASCKSPGECHTAYPHTLEERISSWYAESGSNWTTHAKAGTLLVPTMGTVPCSAEEAAGQVSPTKCPYAADDVTTVIKELDQVLAMRKPGKIHSYVMVASFGQVPDAAVMESLLSQIKSKYVDTGKAKWVKFPDLIDLKKTEK